MVEPNLCELLPPCLAGYLACQIALPYLLLASCHVRIHTSTTASIALQLRRALFISGGHSEVTRLDAPVNNHA